jgi:hypothetical protein
MSYMSECPYKGKTNDTSRKRGNEDNEKAEVAGGMVFMLSCER